MVGDKFGMGMDDTHMAIRGAPVLDEPALSPEQKMIADKLTVSELMSMAVVALPPIVRVRPAYSWVVRGDTAVYSVLTWKCRSKPAVCFPCVHLINGQVSHVSPPAL